MFDYNFYYYICVSVKWHILIFTTYNCNQILDKNVHFYIALSTCETYQGPFLPETLVVARIIPESMMRVERKVKSEYNCKMLPIRYGNSKSNLNNRFAFGIIELNVIY